jgi:hypothetical protein
MTSRPKGLLSNYDDIWLLDGVRTAFADYNTVLGLVSPIDLGIKVAREVFRRSGVSPADVDAVIAGNMAQASFDAYMLPRHIGICSGVPIEVPSHLAQRVCGTGIEVILLSRGQPCKTLTSGSLGQNPARVRRCADRRQQFRRRGWSWRDSGCLRIIRARAWQKAFGPCCRRRCCRCAPGKHGHRSGRGHPHPSRSQRFAPRTNRSLRNQRSIWCPGTGLRARTRHRSCQAKR